LRVKEREDILAQQESLPLSLAGSTGKMAEIANEYLPFAEERDWKRIRHAYSVFISGNADHSM
jgi:hypothetical protein